MTPDCLFEIMKEGEWAGTMTNSTHWTERSTEDFLYSIATDFIEALKGKMKTLGMTQTKLAKEAKVNKSYVSRVFKDPGNLSLETIIKFARTVGMKVSILAYEDEADPNNTSGPIDSDVFRLCWEKAQKPRDHWSIHDGAATTTAARVLFVVPRGRHGSRVPEECGIRVATPEQVRSVFEETAITNRQMPTERGIHYVRTDTVAL